MTIESAQVVYLVAPAGTGKVRIIKYIIYLFYILIIYDTVICFRRSSSLTPHITTSSYKLKQSFSGDYLQVVHGYKHIDGDGPLKSMIIPKYSDMTKDYFATGGKSSSYFGEIAKQTLDAATYHDRVVLTHATYNQESRDVVIDTLVEGGIAKENITVIELTIDPVVKLQGLYHRMKRQLEQKGITMEERHAHLEYEGDDLTEEKFIKAMMEQQNGDMSGGEFEDCPLATKVDVSDRVAHLSNLDKVLELTRSSEDWTYETICAQVLPLDVQRDEECTANGSMELLLELFAELRAASQEAPTQQAREETEEPKQRREESSASTSSSYSKDKHIERTYASSSWEMGRTKSWEDCNWEDYIEADSEEMTELCTSFVSTPAA